MILMKEELSMEFVNDVCWDIQPNPFTMSDEELANSGAFDIEVEVPEDEEMEIYNDYDLVTDLHLLYETLKDLKVNGVAVEVVNGKVTLTKGETTISKRI